MPPPPPPPMRGCDELSSRPEETEGGEQDQHCYAVGRRNPESERHRRVASHFLNKDEEIVFRQTYQTGKSEYLTLDRLVNVPEDIAWQTRELLQGKPEMLSKFIVIVA
uniref:Uncharacterized protein n=1 Tax=Oryza nivara TaxID=4536 RepID=A0A0E0HEU4_ORYNI